MIAGAQTQVQQTAAIAAAAGDAGQQGVVAGFGCGGYRWCGKRVGLLILQLPQQRQAVLRLRVIARGLALFVAQVLVRHP